MSRQDSRENWSQEVTQNSSSLELEEGVFSLQDPRRIAESLTQSAQQSTRRKGSVLQSAMAMLNFYINRAGSQIDPEQKRILEQAKDELRALHGKAPRK